MRFAVSALVHASLLQPAFLRKQMDGPYCSKGIATPDGHCCAESCGTCGGPGCSGRPGGKNNCCTRHITRACESPTDTGCVCPPNMACGAPSLEENFRVFPVGGEEGEEAYCHKDGDLLWWFESGDGGKNPRGVRCSPENDAYCHALTSVAESFCKRGSVVEHVTCERKGPYLPKRPARLTDAGGASSYIIDQEILSPPMEPYFEFEKHQLLCSTFTYTNDQIAGGVTPTPVPTPAPEVYCAEVVDVVVVIDSSGSLTLNGFENAISFVEKLIVHSSIGEQEVRYGVIQYSEPGKYPQANAAAVVVQPLSSDPDSLLEAVRGMKFVGGSTYTGEAMEVALDMLQTSKRAAAATAVLVVTDGQATDWRRLKEAAKKVKDEGSHVMMAVVTAPGTNMLETEATAYSFSSIVSEPTDDNLHVEMSYEALVTKVKDYATQLCQGAKEEEEDDEDDWDDWWSPAVQPPYTPQVWIGCR